MNRIFLIVLLAFLVWIMLCVINLRFCDIEARLPGTMKPACSGAFWTFGYDSASKDKP